MQLSNLLIRDTPELRTADMLNATAFELASYKGQIALNHAHN